MCGSPYRAPGEQLERSKTGRRKKKAHSMQKEKITDGKVKRRRSGPWGGARASRLLAVRRTMGALASGLVIGKTRPSRGGQAPLRQAHCRSCRRRPRVPARYLAGAFARDRCTKGKKTRTAAPRPQQRPTAQSISADCVPRFPLPDRPPGSRNLFSRVSGPD